MARNQSQPRSRMFQVGGKPMKTWNCFVGCRFDCTYCNARRLALTRLKNVPRYEYGFKPRPVESEMLRQFQPGDFVFIAYMGDISFASRSVFHLILRQVVSQPDVNFLVCTKNPKQLQDWFGPSPWPPLPQPDNLYLGATIETTEDYHLSKAPAPADRYEAMRGLAWSKKFISIEPVCDFDLDLMLDWLADIKPGIIEVGADNYHHGLPEPPWEKVQELLACLDSVCSNVVRKVGLERLKKV